MTRRTGIASVLATLAGIALGTISSPASAAVTIGNGLQGTPDNMLGITFLCSVSNRCTVSQVEQQAPFTPAGGLLAPSDGVVVRWRIKVGDTGPVALRVIRRPKPLIEASTGAGTSPTVTPAADQTTTFEVRLPIFTGNAIGIDCCGGNPIAAFDSTSNGSDVQWGWDPALLDNALARDPFDFGGSQLLINADIEPDADGDGFGDETQDQCPTIQGPCPVSPMPSPTASVTGQRAAALKRCKQTAKKKDWTKKRLRKCKQKANLLPV